MRRTTRKMSEPEVVVVGEWKRAARKSKRQRKWENKVPSYESSQVPYLLLLILSIIKQA